MESEKRFYDRRAVKSPLEQFAAEMCRKAGVRFRGIQKGFKHVPDQVMFDNSFGSTLCLPLPGLTATQIQEAFAKSNTAWSGLALKLFSPRKQGA